MGGGGGSRGKQGLFLPPFFLLKPEPGPGQASRSGAEERRWGRGGVGGGGSKHASIPVSTAKLLLIHPRSSGGCGCTGLCVCAQLVCACLKFSRSLNTAGVPTSQQKEKQTSFTQRQPTSAALSIHYPLRLSLSLSLSIYFSTCICH